MTSRRGHRRRPAAWQTGRVPASAAPDALRRRPVGVFDSGVGGLTVLHELLVQLPHEDFVYFADAARFPYGERTAAELEAFSLEIAEELLARRIKLLVVACNSATAAALPALRQRMMQTTLGVDVLGVVQPGAVQAVAATRNGRIGVMATPGDRRQRRLRGGDRGGRPVRGRRRASPARTSRGSSRRGFPFDQRVVDTVARLLRAAARGRGGHGHPRLHALPARAPDAPALPRPRRGDRLLRRARRAPGRARARLARAGLAAGGRGRLLVPVQRRRGGLPRARHALPAAAARRRRDRAAHGRALPGRAGERAASAAAGAARRSCGRPRSSPASSRRRPARR